MTASPDRIVIRDRDGRPRRVVLRRWTNTEPWTHGLVERESAALGAFADQDVPAPRLIAADPRQIAGRAPIDLDAMPARVAETIRRTLDRLG